LIKNSSKNFFSLFSSSSLELSDIAIKKLLKFSSRGFKTRIQPKKAARAGLPDGTVSNQKSKFLGKFWRASE
jgi:hypothetical protein